MTVRLRRFGDDVADCYFDCGLVYPAAMQRTSVAVHTWLSGAETI
jgi:hypothetical protein